MRFLRYLVLLAVLGLVVFWWITKPEFVTDDDLTGLTGDATIGRTVFLAAGCASCHAAPGAVGDDRLKLAGGRKFPSDFGTFLAPNISPDPKQGIGAWSDAEIVTAVMKGVSPSGQHYFPAFPYNAYNKANVEDIVHLVAYLRTLPKDATPSEPHEVGFPFNIRRTLGGWKFLFTSEKWVMGDANTEEVLRGRYLVEAMAHCGECHTPRNPLGGLKRNAWLSGAPIPGTKNGITPGITPAQLEWSAADIVEYLTSGFTPEFDTAGGHMVEVIENMAELSDADRAAVAAYLKALP